MKNGNRRENESCDPASRAEGHRELQESRVAEERKRFPPYTPNQAEKVTFGHSSPFGKQREQTR